MELLFNIKKNKNYFFLNVFIKVNAADVGAIQKLRIGHDNANPSPGWFVEKILIQRLKISAEKRRRASISSRHTIDETENQVENYWFFVNKWFAKDEGDKQIVRVLLPQDENGKYLSNLDCEFFFY